jgi:hypothetical protein
VVSDTPALLQTIERSCRHLEKTAKDMNMVLRPAISSVADLEEIIRALRESNVDDETLKGATFLVGAYLGEILRSRLGGDWIKSQEGELALAIGDSQYFPVSKARKFASDPSGGDSLEFFASAVVSRHGDSRDA